MTETDWRQRARCRIDGTPQQIREFADKFFPYPTDKAGRLEAQNVCRNCPVAPQCQAEAEALNVTYGVWAGKQYDVAQPAGNPPNCGTERAYYRHMQLGETCDPACLAAAQRAWERRKKHHHNTKTGSNSDV